MEKYAKFIDTAKKLGADNAKVIKTESIVTAAWVRWKCHYGCSMYGSSLCCPPTTPDWRETKELIQCYENALLVHYKKGFQGKTNPTEIVTQLEKELFFAGYYKAFALGGGPCKLCGLCAKGQCVHPGDARPSMESCGIDVFTTVRNNGFSIKVLKKGYEEILAEKSPKVDRFGLVLIE
jgi:predicted metal-binding protein